MTTERPRIRLLGGFSVEFDGAGVESGAWRLRKAQALVKLLALAPGRRLHRDQLAEALWPERDAASSANNLHQALHAARRAIGTDALRLAGGVVTLEASVDVERFETAARAAHGSGDADGHDDALSLYGGELLPEDRYEPWTAARRVALRELHTTLCLELAQLRDGTPAAITALQRAIAADPLAERAYRALMTAYAASGRRTEALASFEQLRADLRTDLGADPEPTTRALYRDLLATTTADPPARRDNLPRRLTSFVGREREQADVERLLARTPLLTLTGPGGAGKTRLALEVAARAAARDATHVWLVELAGVGDGDFVAQAAAAAIGVPLPSQRPLLGALAAHLAPLDTLLVLDNCEHLADACAVLVEGLLAAAPRLRVLATSREPLRCPGEVTWRVPALAEARRLFAERAASARPGFALGPPEEAIVAKICERLDGMPLAIELAAARVGALTLEQLAARLGDSLDVLGDGSRTALTRQQTLRAAIGWSHELLDGEERLLFRRLAVFAGSFTLEAAEDVCAGGAIERRRVAALAARLVDKSLVVAEGERLRLLDTIRQYASERLAASGERDRVALRHLDWCLALAEHHDPVAAGPHRSLRALEAEHDNLRAALAFALRSDPQAALRLAVRLWRFWLDRDHFAEGTRWLNAAIARAPEETPLRAEALLAGAGLALRRGDSAGYRQRGTDAYSTLGDEHARVEHLYQHAMLEQSVSSPAAPELFDRALADAERLGDPGLLAAITHASALVPWYRSDTTAAAERVRAALAQLHALPDDDRAFFSGTTFGLCPLLDGPDGGPRLHWDETLYLFHRFARGPAIGYALNNLAWAMRAEGEPGSARAALEEALERFRRMRDRAGEALTLNHLGCLERSLEDYDAGRERFGAALTVRRVLGDRRAIGMSTMGLGLLEIGAGDASQGEALLREAVERAEAVDDLPAMAGTRSNWGLLEERSGRPEHAAELLEAGASLWGSQAQTRFEGWTRAALGAVRDTLGDTEGAERDRVRAVTLLTAAGDERGAVRATQSPR
ncbi:MAG: BTAD domain-containing putative transcriptional regulator [Solirubrobacteraceae bacterium]